MQPTLQTSSRNDSRVWRGIGYSRSVATGGGARVATDKRRGGAGADRIGQDLRLRAALSEPENSGCVHRSDPRSSKYRPIALVDRLAQPARLPLQKTCEFIHHKRLVSWNRRLCGRTGVGVRSSKAAGHDYQSRPLVSLIHASPLALSKTRTVTGATKPAQPKGGAGLASSHLQAGVT